MKIYIGSDVSGNNLKAQVKDYLVSLNYDVVDLTVDEDDFFVAGYEVGKNVSENNGDVGIAICGNGYGVTHVSSLFPNVRAINAVTVSQAKTGRIVNDANILTLGAKQVTENVAYDIVNTFLNTEFATGLPAETKEFLHTAFAKIEKLREDL